MTRYEFTGVKTLENLQGYFDEYHFRYNSRNNLGTIFNLYQTPIINSLIHFDKYFIKKTQKDLVHPLCVSG